MLLVYCCVNYWVFEFDLFEFEEKLDCRKKWIIVMRKVGILK